ncbi:hypothetical protein Cpir12675_001933 [Ceratocystis pirilliformis]|uniref:PEBP-like protein n=1 Tax=Ceratocystis pirilliformis TaxID=259994 RepID=A0ABR3ZCG9_9PEZI
MKTSFASLLTSVTASLAASPSGFLPSSINPLIVAYGKNTVVDGVVMTQNETQTAPTLATSSHLQGTFSIFMIDSNVPSNTTSSGTTTLLHWALTGLSSSNASTNLNGKPAHILKPASNSTAPLAKYIGPAPPARVPLSHQYTLILVNDTSLTSSNRKRLQKAAGTRLGFDAPTVLGATSLSLDTVAASYFNVTNSAKGLVDTGSGLNSTTGNNGRSGSGSGSGSARGSGGSSSNRPAQTNPAASGSGAANSTSISTSGPNPSTTGVISAARELELSRTATVVICLLTVGAGFVGL